MSCQSEQQRRVGLLALKYLYGSKSVRQRRQSGPLNSYWKRDIAFRLLAVFLKADKAESMQDTDDQG